MPSRAGDDLRERRLVALAVAVRAGEDGDLAGRMHAHLAGLEQAGARAERAGDVRRRDAAGLDVGRVAEAAQLAALAPTAALRAGKPATSAISIALSSVRVVVADVVGQRRPASRTGSSVMKLLPPDLGRVHLHLARRLLDDALDDVGRLGPAGAAVGVDRRGVGEHRLHLAVDRRRRVLAGEQRRVEDRRHARREGRQVGAHVGGRLHAQREELAVLVQRQLGVRDVVAAVRVGEERLRCARPST